MRNYTGNQGYEFGETFYGKQLQLQAVLCCLQTTEPLTQKCNEA